MIRARWFVLAGLLLAGLGLVVGLRAELALGVRTAGALASVIPGEPPTPLRWTPSPSVVEVDYATAGGVEVRADLYEPGADTVRPALVLVVGVVKEGRKHPTLVKLADGFARAGFVVLVPDTLDYASLRVVPGDIDALVAGYQFLAQRPSVDDTSVGIVGFSVGGALSLVAASDPRIADDVALVIAVGAYHDLDTMLQAVTTDHVSVDGEWSAYHPHPYAWGVVRNTLVSQLAEPSDQRALFDLFGGSTPDPVASDGAAPDPDRLTPAGRAVFELFTNRDPLRTGRLLARIRDFLPGTLDSVSPVAHVDRLRASVLLLHDKGDEYIPVSESRRLHRRLGVEQARFETLDVIRHVELTAPDLSPRAILGSYVPGLWTLVTSVAQALNAL